MNNGADTPLPTAPAGRPRAQHLSRAACLPRWCEEGVRMNVLGQLGWSELPQTWPGGTVCRPAFFAGW
jgi:hypothetical protein